MNIKDLPKGSYSIEEPSVLNIRDLPPDAYSFDDSQASLVHSQQTIDQMRTDAQQAQQEADVAQSKTFDTPPDWQRNLFAAGGAILGGMAGGAAGSIAGPAGTLAGAVGGAGAGAAGGEALQQKLFSGKVSPSEIAKTGEEYGALEAVGGPLTRLAGKAVRGVGEKIAKAFIPTSEREAGLLQTYLAKNPFWKRIGDVLTGKTTKVPTTAADTAFSKGLMGTETGIGIRAKRASTKLWSGVVEPALDQSKEQVSMPTFFQEAEKNIIKNAKELGDRNARIQALEAIKEEYSKNPIATMKELQGYKEGWASHVPEKAYKGKDITQTYNNVRNELSDLARGKIYSALGDNVKQAYFDYGNLKGLQELGKKAMTGGKLKGGFGSFWSAVKDMALVPISTIGGQTVYKVGQGIELVGAPNARFVRDLFPVPFDSQNSEDGLQIQDDTNNGIQDNPSQ